MTKTKVSELEGSALDWAVAMCEGAEHGLTAIEIFKSDLHRYSSEWSRGGPIIARERITLDARESCWHARIWNDTKEDFIEAEYVSTPLVAAMRCYVASRLGHRIDVPDFD